MDTTPEYKSLAEIRLRKELLRNDILRDDQKIHNLWNDLFHAPSAALGSKSTTTRRFSGLINTGAGILDGVILGWKLYRKFKNRK
jgi:hypothetical protein